jgi:predicted oxidoreductase
MKEMKIALEKNGPVVSRIAYGLMRLNDWNISRSQLCERIEQLVELGVTTFDHADIYGDYTCEALFGEALSSIPSMREKIQLVTKCGIRLISKHNPNCTIKHYDTTRTHIITSVENSLKRLHTDYIDLLLIHRPDPLMDVDEIAGTFVALKKSGKVLFFGVSNFSALQFELLFSRLPFPLVTNQIECSVLHTMSFEDCTIDMCKKHNIAPMAWSPLGGGRLFYGKSKQILRVRAVLKALCGDLGLDSLDKLALAWVLSHPADIVPVIGTGKMERVNHALESLKIDLPREEWFKIWTASIGRDVP